MMKIFALLTILLTSFFLGCTSKKENKPATVVPRTLGTIVTDSVSPPVITLITKTNAPKVIKAGAPFIVPLAYPFGVGVPSITNYSYTDGLPSNNVYASDIDQHGNIWFATDAGISKYDGQGFTNYNSGNGLVSGIPRNLVVDRNNNIWISTYYDLCIFDGKFFTKMEFEKDHSKYTFIDKIFEDKSGVIWIATAKGLYKYKDKTFKKYTTADGLSGNSISFIIQDKNGDLLITTDEGLNRYDGKTFTAYTSIPFSKASRGTHFLFCDSKGNIWFNNGTGLLGKYDGKKIKMFTQKERGMLMDTRSPIAFLEDKNGNLWFGGLGEFTKYDGKKFINYAPKINFDESFQIFSLTVDEFQNIWAGTSVEGIYKINGPLLTKMETNYGYNKGFALDSSDVKWLIGWDGIAKYNSDHVAVFGKGQFDSPLYDLFIDRKGHKWFTVVDIDTRLVNIIKFDGTEFTIFGKAQWPSIRTINDMIFDDSNHLWFMTINGRVAKYDGFSFKEYGPAQGLKSNRIISIFKDSKNNIWFGSFSSGAFKFDGQKFINYNIQDGLPSNSINGFTEDALGNLWFATNAGAVKFDGKKFKIYSEDKGLSNVVVGVKFDPVNQIIWFNTGFGLASLKLGQVNDVAPVFQHFNSRTGFNFSIINNLTFDNQGTVWVLENGVLRFDYKRIKDLQPFPLHIKNIKLNNKQINWSSLRQENYPLTTKDSLTAVNEIALKFGRPFSNEDFKVMSDEFGKVSYDSVAGTAFIPVNLVLPIKNNHISFEFGTESPTFGKSIQYQFRLEGYDKNWSQLSSKREASFGNMSEGVYTFRVKALSPFGNWSEASYSFTVLAPWYRTWWAYTSYILSLGMAIFTFIQWRTKTLQREKGILEEKVSIRTSELNQSLQNLKSTQSQLIQSEKMASLGELTAGIAHEIQNPLNFVNNFSEVSSELIDEMTEELKKGDIEEGIIISADLKQNLEKINHHGKRASDIVKGMLEHSRTSAGQKEPTDINALCDEYLRLAYHGMKAKDNDFNATMETHFDPNLPKIDIIPQDLGRVILNLINNAFYAGIERSKKGEEGYQPTVTIMTQQTPDNQLKISVKDNGSGIPDAIKDKIFQPFFTTKPTGQGTGLGLSLSYDIVKAHGGEIKVNTKENDGTEFTIQLTIK